MSSIIRSHMNGRLAKKRGAMQIAQDAQITTAQLQAAGIGMDAALTGGGAGGVPGYISRTALETWLPGTLRNITQVRNAERIMGLTVAGRPYDEEIRLQIEEAAGQPEIYGDNTPIPYADIRHTVESRRPVTFELGFQVGTREQQRLSASGIDATTNKRRAVSDALGVTLNAIAFFGYNSSASNVYGLLNEPNLANYETHGNGNFSNTAWANATFDSIIKDFEAMVAKIIEQSGGNVQSDSQFVWTIPTKFLSILGLMQGVTGKSVRQYLTEVYPSLRIENAPELNDAETTGATYLYVENAGAFADDDFDGATLSQIVPDRFSVIGSNQGIKGFVEDCTATTAGVWVLRPWAVTRLIV